MSKSPWILLNKNINLPSVLPKTFKKKMEIKRYWKQNGIENEKSHTHCFRETNLCFSSYKNRKLKGKLSWVGAREKKRGHFLNRLFCPEEIFFNICILSNYMVYWIYFQNIHTFTYQKILFHTHFCLFLKSPKAFSVSLILFSNSLWWLQYLEIMVMVKYASWLDSHLLIMI